MGTCVSTSKATNHQRSRKCKAEKKRRGRRSAQAGPQPATTQRTENSPALSYSSSNAINGAEMDHDIVSGSNPLEGSGKREKKSLGVSVSPTITSPTSQLKSQGLEIALPHFSPLPTSDWTPPVKETQEAEGQLSHPVQRHRSPVKRSKSSAFSAPRSRSRGASSIAARLLQARFSGQSSPRGDSSVAGEELRSSSQGDSLLQRTDSLTSEVGSPMEFLQMKEAPTGAGPMISCKSLSSTGAEALGGLGHGDDEFLEDDDDEDLLDTSAPLTDLPECEHDCPVTTFLCASASSSALSFSSRSSSHCPSPVGGTKKVLPRLVVRVRGWVNDLGRDAPHPFIQSTSGSTGTMDLPGSPFGTSHVILSRQTLARHARSLAVLRSDSTPNTAAHLGSATTSPFDPFEGDRRLSQHTLGSSTQDFEELAEEGEDDSNTFYVSFLSSA